MDRVWPGKIEKSKAGAHQFVNWDDLDEFTVWLGRFEPGTEVDIIVRKRQTRASNAQNRYYWPVIVHAISESTGHTPEEIHDILKWKFLKKRDDQGIEFVPSTMDISTRDREQYHEDCRRWAAVVLGLSIPLPNEVDYAPQES